jgi:hypothetical protein
MGAAISYLLALEALHTSDLLPQGITIKVVAFGGPRVGNKKLCRYWRDAVQKYKESHGSNSFHEYFVKAYNDGNVLALIQADVCLTILTPIGVPALPPVSFGYHHFCQTPLYLVYGRVYHIPGSEYEHSSFSVATSERDRDELPFPRGGHNYYNGRDMERLARRMDLLVEAMNDGPDWEERYRDKLNERERRYSPKA